MKILVTEGKSNRIEQLHHLNSVRVFFGRDYDYGYFIPESIVYEALSDTDKSEYFNQDKFEIDEDTVTMLKENGLTYP